MALRDLRSRADAEDVRNETLIRVLQAIRADRLVSASALPSFVLATARNVIREFGRQGRRAEPIEASEFAARDPSSEVDPNVNRAIEIPISPVKHRKRSLLRLI